MRNVPLVVDLDGTLVKTDMLIESVIFSRVHYKKAFIPLAIGFLRGKAKFKELAARDFKVDTASLPFHDGVLELIQHHSMAGHDIVLATASAEAIAKQIADQLGFFTLVLSSTENLNLSGPNKASVLVETFGVNGFDYVGNSVKDLPVWEVARTKYLAGKNWRARRVFNKLNGGVELQDLTEKRSVKKWARAIRIHQWAKNLLLFVPFVAAHETLTFTSATTLLSAFFAFSFLASSVYLLNDVVDIQSDRAHPTKRFRPIPNGAISIGMALTVAFALFLAALSVGASLAIEFTLLFFTYWLLTSLYTFWFKRLLLIDVVTLAVLYTLRVVAGGSAVGIQVSPWLLVFSFFLFLSLAFVKRSSELTSHTRSDAALANSRPYRVRDLSVVNTQGIVSGFASILVFTLYLSSDTVTLLYENSETLWFAVPLLTFWISRLWVLASRGDVDEDPILFATQDKTSLMSGVAFLAIFLIAQQGLA